MTKILIASLLALAACSTKPQSGKDGTGQTGDVRTDIGSKQPPTDLSRVNGASPTETPVGDAGVDAAGSGSGSGSAAAPMPR